jgi:hypothetical protein
MISCTSNNFANSEITKGDYGAKWTSLYPIFACIWVICIEFTFRHFFGVKTVFNLDSHYQWLLAVQFI